MISCILLAAGSSKRFGSPKALASINGKQAVTLLQETYVASIIDELIIVLGDHQEKVKPYLFNHKKIKIVYNKDYKFGQTSSFQAGLRALGGFSQGIMLQPVDIPLVAVQTVNALSKNFVEEKPRILIPTHQGRRGHPPVFNTCLRKALLALDQNTGINTFEHAHENEVSLLAVQDPGILKGFNTQDELAHLSNETNDRFPTI